MRGRWQGPAAPAQILVKQLPGDPASLVRQNASSESFEGCQQSWEKQPHNWQDCRFDNDRADLSELSSSRFPPPPGRHLHRRWNQSCSDFASFGRRNHQRRQHGNQSHQHGNSTPGSEVSKLTACDPCHQDRPLWESLGSKAHLSWARSHS